MKFNFKEIEYNYPSIHDGSTTFFIDKLRNMNGDQISITTESVGDWLNIYVNGSILSMSLPHKNCIIVFEKL